MRDPLASSRILLLHAAIVITGCTLGTDAAAATTICGDLNGSGTIGASDALLLLKKAVGQQVTISCPDCSSVASDAEQQGFAQSQMCGDLDGSGKIGASDALMLLRHAVGQDVPISCPVCSTTTTTTTTMPAGNGCGNGVRDGAEECEGLDGCEASERCTALCTCEPRPTPPASSQTLIAQALERGDIDYPTSILYRVWALFGAPELPEAYDGAGSMGEDIGLVIELSHVRGGLPAQIEAAIAPYLVRPTDPSSIYSQQPSAASASLDPQAAAPAPVGCPAVNNVPDWGSSETEHFVIWSCETGRCEHGKPVTTACHDHEDCDTAPGALDGYCTAPADLARREVVGSVAEEVYAAYSPKLGAPRPDSFQFGPEPTGRIDIYMLRPNECRMRGNWCVPIPGDALAAAMPDAPCDNSRGGPLTSSAYALINASRVPVAAPAPNESSPFRADVDHELFHVYEYGLNVEVMGLACVPDLITDASKENSWLTEASAEWASFGFFPIDDAERRTGFLQDFQYRNAATLGLQQNGGPLPYEAALYLQFVQQEAGTIQPLIDLWTKSQGARNNEEFDTHFDSILSFSDHFRDFGVRMLNKELPGAPIAPMFADLDEARTRNVLPSVLQPEAQLVPDMLFLRRVDVAPLFAQHEMYALDDTVRYVRIDMSDVPNAEHLQIDAIVKVGSDWERRKVEGPIFQFCREDEGDDISEFYLVVSNFDRRADGKVKADYDLITRSYCPGGWTGYIRFTDTLDEHSETTDALTTTVVEIHEHDEQTWSVIGTETVSSEDVFYDIVTMAWRASHSVENLTTTIDEDCGVSTFTETSNRSAGVNTPFWAFPAATPGSFSFGPSEQAHTFNAPVTYKTSQCGQGTSTGTGTDVVDEAFLVFLAVPDFGNLTPLPDDPGHFVGSAVILHDEQNVGDVGLQVTDVSVSWDLRRTEAR